MKKIIIILTFCLLGAIACTKKSDELKIGLIETVLVKAGSFNMGLEDGNKVTLTKDYYVGTYEVTQKQWFEVMGNKPSLNAPETGWENFPVETVEWYDSVVFCNALSELEGLEPYYSIDGTNVTIIDENGKGYRLPTEAEWEYAARGGKDGDHSLEYAGSNNIEDVAWYSDNSDNETKEVGLKQANGLGLYDMTGNVWEWCWDWHELPLSDGNSIDPAGPDVGSFRVHRGGSYAHSPDPSRVANRSHGTACPTNLRGFRVVRSL